MADTFTPNLGLRKPDPLSVVDVATALNNNYDLLDTAVQGAINGAVQNIPVVSSSADVSAYPFGMSMFFLNDTQLAADTGWPAASLHGTNDWAMVITARPTGTGGGGQFYCKIGKGGSGVSNVYYRGGNTTGWDSWRPLGASVPISSGLTWAIQSGWSMGPYWMRRENSCIRAYFTTTRTGADIVADTTGNVADVPVVTMPAAWQPLASLISAFDAVQIEGTVNGVATWFGRIEGGGAVKLTHGLPNARITNTSYNRVDWKAFYPYI